MSEVWVIGANGQLGCALMEHYGAKARGFTRADLDLDQLPEATRRLAELPAPKIIFNATAYNQVDQAETDRAACLHTNALVPASLATFARGVGADFYHYSTDFVYSGEGDRPWRGEDAPAPVNAYGAAKLAGEVAVLEAHPHARVLRTSWVYSHRRQNFPLAILKRAKETMALTVVTDQIGSPTSAVSLAELSARIAERPADAATAGVYNISDAGYVSRYDFAREIIAIATRFDMDLIGANFTGVTSSEHPAAARRPLNTRMDLSKVQSTFGVTCPEWRDTLRQMIRRHYEGA